MRYVSGLRRIPSTYLLAALVSLTAAVAIACGSGDDATATSTTAPATATSTSVASSSTPTVGPTSTTAAATATATSPAATTVPSSVTVNLLNTAANGDILVGENGLALYIFDRDTEGVSNCTGGCLAAWPPVLTDSAPAAGDGVTADIGTITLADGNMQVTVDGFPAYYWQGDANAGDTSGNAVNGVWWVFNPDGSPQRPAKVGHVENSTLGNILVDGDGRTLYIFDNDSEGVSNCSGGCLANWPPLLTEYAPVALADVTAEIGTITRSDGTMQVTVNGFPAYYWVGDAAAGDTNGQAVGGVWWVFNPDGSPQRPAKVGLAENPTLGNILVDGAGRTLYLFDNDTVGVSNCTGGCLANWPPLLTEYAPVALANVTAEISTITLSDGTMQVTVNGLPAYHWVGDAAAGDTNGQAVGGRWWVMMADGTAVRN